MADPFFFLTLPATLYMVVAFAAPVLTFVTTSFVAGEHVSLGHYIEYFSDTYNLQVILNTVTYAFLVTVGGLVIGFPYAMIMARLPLKVQGLLLVITILPLTAGIVVKTFGWTVLLRGGGVINEVLLAAGFIEAPLRLLYSKAGLYLGSINLTLPFMILPIFSVLRQVPPNLNEAAECLGADRIYTFLHVTLPLSVPGITAGAAFVFCQTASAYVMPGLLIGERYKVMADQVVTSFQVFNKIALGSTVSVVLLVLLGLFFVAMAIVNRRYAV